jgi:hypothetical protein
MAENNIAKQYYITVGLILGGAFSFTVFIAHLMGMSHIPGDNIALLNMVIFLFVAFISGKQYRDKLHEGPLMYWQAFNYLVKISLYSAVVFGLFGFFYYQFIAPGDIDFFINQMTQNMKEWGKMPEDQLNALMELYKSALNASSMAFLTWLYQLIGSTFFSLLVASLLKTSERILKP